MRVTEHTVGPGRGGEGTGGGTLLCPTCVPPRWVGRRADGLEHVSMTVSETRYHQSATSHSQILLCFFRGNKTQVDSFVQNIFTFKKSAILDNNFGNKSGRGSRRD